jgi:chromate transport protein ChrA
MDFDYSQKFMSRLKTRVLNWERVGYQNSFTWWGVFPNAVIMVTFSGSAPEWPNNSFIKRIHLGVKKLIIYGILTEKTYFSTN